MPTPFKRKLDARRGFARLTFARPDELAFLGAAYLMTQDAYVELEKRGHVRSAVLRPKGAARLAALASGFELEYENQLLRWTVARQSRALRNETLRRALILADRSGAGTHAPQEGLSPEQKAEIARLLAEAEAAPKDPLGIAAPWEETRRRGS